MTEPVRRDVAAVRAAIEAANKLVSAPDAEVLQVPALVHGRVMLELPPGGAEPEALLVGFHGYGQRAEDALAFLRPLAAGKPWAIAAPQALHPFYRKDGSIVSCWMTSLDRELALADNVVYAARAVADLRQRVPSARRLAIVGFSQGVAMAYRAAARCGQRVDALVALAGDVPPELRSDGWGSHPTVLIGRGSEEQWYGEDKLAADEETLRGLGLPYEVHRFTGGHEWAPEMVEKAAAFLGRRLGG